MKFVSIGDLKEVIIIYMLLGENLDCNQQKGSQQKCPPKFIKIFVKLAKSR